MPTTNLSNKLGQEILKYKPSKVFIDVGGLGVGIYDQLISMGHNVTAINFGEKPDNPDKYFNKRAEMYGRAKQWLDDKPCSINNTDKPTMDALQADLTSVQYGWTNNQQLKLEPKVDLKKRGLPSPDYADAFVLTFAQPVAATLVHRPNMMNPVYTDIDWNPF